MYLDYKSHICILQKFWKIQKKSFFLAHKVWRRVNFDPNRSFDSNQWSPPMDPHNHFHHASSAEINNKVTVVEYGMRNLIHPIRNWIWFKRLLKHRHHIFRNCN